MSLIPSPHVVTVREPGTPTVDGFGNQVPGAPTTRTWAVRSIDPGSSAEPLGANRDLSRVEYVIHADKTSDAPSEDADVQVGGEWFRVAKRPEDWTRGPWPNPAAGVVVLLERVDG